MGLKIATNIASLAVQKNLSQSNNDIKNEIDKLSSGKRVSSAADDAAGLALATKFEASVRSMRQAKRNAGDGKSLIQTAEGALNESSSIMMRMRELSVQSSSDTLGEAEREMVDREYQQLLDEVDRIAASTEFNGINVLDGQSDGVLDIQVGINSGEENAIQFDPGVTDATTSSLGIEGSGVSQKEDAWDAMGAIDEAMDSLSNQRAELGALQNRMDITQNNLETQILNTEEAKSNIQDTDYAESSAKLASAKLKQNAGISVLAQANQVSSRVLKLIG